MHAAPRPRSRRSEHENAISHCRARAAGDDKPFVDRGAGLACDALGGDLAQVIDWITGRGGTVRLIGDDQQLASVASGGVLRDLAERHGAVTLSQVMRFRDPAEGAASLALRAGDGSALGYYLDKARMTPMYSDLNRRVRKLLPSIPLVGDQADRWLQQMKDAIKASLHGGMLFEELGFTYIGPIDGHDLRTLRNYLEKVKAMDGPVLLHVLTDKGHGFEPAVKDPVKFHAPAPFQRVEDGIIPLKTSSRRAYTDVVSAALLAAVGRDSRVAILTATNAGGERLRSIVRTDQ